MAISKKGKNCSGCTACYSVCPKKCIQMKPDALGFKYPEVNYDECIECGLCERTCPFDIDVKPTSTVRKTFAVRNKSQEEMRNSSSGAAFVAISDYFIQNNGVVYGADFDSNMKVAHSRATDKIGRDRQRGSKYVQSNIDSTISSIKQDLKEGKIVLFTGTPCQVAGVKSAIPKTLRENLLLVDIICHGCPSPAVWEEYVNWVKDKYTVDPTYVKFRDKNTAGWKAYTELFFSETGLVKDLNFIELFKKDVILRESCGSCPFSSLGRPGDITIGDYWGYEKHIPDFNEDGLGISLMLLNSETGEKYFQKFNNNLTFREMDIKDCLQRNLERPTPLNPKSAEFAKDFETHGIVYVMKKYGEYGAVNRIKKLSRRIINKLKRMIK